MKKKILVLSDHPLSPSGVGTQTKYFIEALIKTGRYSFICLGGAIKHEDYTPQTVEPHGADWRIFPIDGYGNHEMIRSVIQKEKPDVLWFMTDPRFYGWLWEIENEVRANLPMVYYHVWDNFPAPVFNGSFYRSTDEVVCISKVTHEILKDVAPTTSSRYLPHAVDPQIFHKFKTPQEMKITEQVRENITVNSSYNLKNKDKKIFFWNSRNARRKQSGTLVWWFKEFLDIVGEDQACLLMHTDARDPHGTDLPHIIEHLGANDGQVLLSTDKVDATHLASLYNAADYTIAISDAEGFGLSMLESLSCGTPIIATMTGGMQEQITDGKNWFGFGIEPASKAVIGSLQVPYIYEDRISQEGFNEALQKAMSWSPKAYEKMCRQGQAHVKKNYSFESYQKKWIEAIDEIVEKHGSWGTRKNYDRWHLLEVA
jgi:glycosyltransferase involved in cell wall biosynthesis|tara:strand:+ start:1051 stop:2334 length:1284 start_codon:yes stop_codon:yes gene_type:complete